MGYSEKLILLVVGATLFVRAVVGAGAGANHCLDEIRGIFLGINVTVVVYCKQRLGGV